MVSFRSLVALVALSTVSFAHPIAELRSRDIKIVGRTTTTVVARQASNSTDFDALFQGNDAFKKSDPSLLKKLADDGQGASTPFRPPLQDADGRPRRASFHVLGMLRQPSQ